MASREEKKASNRRKLLDAAATLVANKGAVATSLDAIAEKAGLTKGAVYSNFRSKEDLIEELARVAAVSISAEAAMIDETRPVAEMLVDLGREIESTFQGASSRTWRLTFEILNYAHHNAKVRRDIATEWRRSRDESSEWYERVSKRTGEELLVSGAEISLVLEAIVLGVATLDTIDPGSIPAGFVSRALRLVVRDP